MKKLTGTILLATALFAHVGIVVATEESYIFSAAEHQTTPLINSVADTKTAFDNEQSGGQSLFTNSIEQTGMFSVEEAHFAF